MIEELFIDALQIHDQPPLPDYAVSRFPGIGSPPPRVDHPNRARRHGAYGLTTYYEPRRLPIAGKLAEATYAAFWPKLDALKEAVALVGSSHVLKFKRSGLSYYERMVVLVEAEFDPGLHNHEPYAEWETELLAPDPRMYADTLQTVNFASAATITNGGNFSTPPVVTFHGAGTNPGLRNNALSTQNEIRLAYTMVGGDTVVVDMADQTVKLNGADRPDLVNMGNPSYFWQLVKGSNSLTKLGGAVSVDVDWRDARI